MHSLKLGRVRRGISASLVMIWMLDGKYRRRICTLIRERRRRKVRPVSVVVPHYPLPHIPLPNLYLSSFYNTTSHTSRPSHPLLEQLVNNPLRAFGVQIRWISGTKKSSDRWCHRKRAGIHGLRPISYASFFVEAIETQKFGWFWECPNGGGAYHLLRTRN